MLGAPYYLSRCSNFQIFIVSLARCPFGSLGNMQWVGIGLDMGVCY